MLKAMARVQDHETENMQTLPTPEEYLKSCQDRILHLINMSIALKEHHLISYIEQIKDLKTKPDINACQVIKALNDVFYPLQEIVFINILELYQATTLTIIQEDIPIIVKKYGNVSILFDKYYDGINVFFKKMNIPNEDNQTLKSIIFNNPSFCEQYHDHLVYKILFDLHNIKNINNIIISEINEHIKNRKCKLSQEQMQIIITCRNKIDLTINNIKDNITDKWKLAIHSYMNI